MDADRGKDTFDSLDAKVEQQQQRLRSEGGRDGVLHWKRAEVKSNNEFMSLSWGI